MGFCCNQNIFDSLTHSSGVPIADASAFTASNATLITNNTHEFQRVENLKVLSWQEL